MASFILEVEDNSPLISYAPDGAWLDTPSIDTLAASYSGGSLHAASQLGATATISFHGTGITFFGGHRSNYGTFSISVDGQTATSGNANSVQNTTNQELGSALNLANGFHTAVLMNTGGAPIDIDYINVEIQPSPSSINVTSITIDDVDSRIQYLPSASAWNLTQNQMYLDGTLHFTNVVGASASLSFNGDAVAVYGTTAPDHADVQITLDNYTTSFTGGADGFVSQLHTRVLLYYANNLSSDPHTLSMTSTGEGGPFIDIDAITIYSSGTSSSSSSSGPGSDSPEGSPSTNPTQLSQTGSKVPITPIIGGLIGGIGVVLVLVFFFLQYRRRRRRTGNTLVSQHRPTSPRTPELPMQDVSVMEAGLSQAEVQTRYPNTTYIPARARGLAPNIPNKRETMHSIAPSYYSDPTYASEMSSPQSLTGLLPPLPTSPARLASPSRYASEVPRSLDPATMGVNVSSMRPNRRPPPLNTGY